MNQYDKRISVIGIGKLGLCFALTLENSGFGVMGVDLDKNYITKLNNKTLQSSEPNLESYLKSSKKFKATTSIKKSVEFSNILFLFVATPSLESGCYDHSQIKSVVSQLKSLGEQKKQKHLIIGCTTMPGYCDFVQKELKQLGYTVSYNPEFIAQGSILKDLVNPDVLLIGEGNKLAGEEIESIYSCILKKNPTIHRMSRKEAEISKIALNCFLTTKIAFANMIGDIAQLSGCDPAKILNSIGSDSRVGKKYLKYGFGFGGPCLPRDNKALAIFANEIGVNPLISNASDKSNAEHLKHQITHFTQNNSKIDPVNISGVTYNLNTEIIEESQQFEFAIALAKSGFKVVIEESENVVKEIKKLHPNLFEYKLKS